MCSPVQGTEIRFAGFVELLMHGRRSGSGRAAFFSRAWNFSWASLTVRAPKMNSQICGIFPPLAASHKYSPHSSSRYIYYYPSVSRTRNSSKSVAFSSCNFSHFQQIIKCPLSTFFLYAADDSRYADTLWREGISIAATAGQTVMREKTKMKLNLTAIQFSFAL